MDWDIRLMVDDFYSATVTLLNRYSNQYSKNDLAVGRVEVCIEGSYDSLCEEFWNSQSVSVVCSQLGFSPYGEL